jgi:hypothetical protein
VSVDLREVLRRNLHPEYNTIPLADALTAVDELLQERDQARGERDRLLARGDFLREMLALLSVSYVPTDQVLRWLDRPEPPSAALLKQAEFPLPIRADGTHWYLSTGCLHGDEVLPDGRTGHEYCQGETGHCGTKAPAQCKFCPDEPCQCPCHGPKSCRWPACLSEAEQQQVADDVDAGMRGEETTPGPDPRPGCGCVDGGPDLTREELQDLADEQGRDLYRAQDLIAFVREMCDAADADGSEVTTARVRTWLAYTGCGGVLALPPEAVAALATMSGETPDKAVSSSDTADKTGERQ